MSGKEIIQGEINIIVGETRTFDFYLEFESMFPRPIDLTDFDEFKIILPKIDDEFLTITQDANANDSQIVKVAPDTVGHLRLTLNAADSSLLKSGFAQDFEIHRSNSTTENLKKIKFVKGLNVEASLG